VFNSSLYRFQLAREYLKVQTEMAYLSRYKEQLVEKLSEAEGRSQLDQQDSEQQEEQLRNLTNEKVSVAQGRVGPRVETSPPREIPKADLTEFVGWGNSEGREM